MLRPETLPVPQTAVQSLNFRARINHCFPPLPELQHPFVVTLSSRRSRVPHDNTHKHSFFVPRLLLYIVSKSESFGLKTKRKS